LQFSLQAASPETFGYTLIYEYSELLFSISQNQLTSGKQEDKIFKSKCPVRKKRDNYFEG
jgi:hypothetical protein